jgi:type II secretory ATPase GspE/PulE/Tfp pilus assembly ATPase PilB-like protein
VFEVLEISKGIREAILKGKPAMQIREIAQSEGRMTLEQAMRSKVQRGITSIEELHRVISTYGV